MRLTSRLSIGDSNDQHRLSELTRAGLLDERVDDLLLQAGSHRGETLELDTTHEVFDLGFLGYVVCQVVGQVGVHESNVDAISIEERRGKCDPLQNKAQILDALATLFELHGTRVI